MESIWLLTQHGDRAHRVNAEGTSLDEHQQLVNITVYVIFIWLILG